MSLVPENWSFLDGLLARVEGPLSLRFILQPLIALIFSIQDGVSDARKGHPPYFWGLFTEPTHRRYILESSWKSIGKVFIVAILVDCVFQFLVFHEIRPIGALLAGLILAIIPYILLRGPVNRLMRLSHERHKS